MSVAINVYRYVMRSLGAVGKNVHGSSAMDLHWAAELGARFPGFEPRGSTQTGTNENLASLLATGGKLAAMRKFTRPT